MKKLLALALALCMVFAMGTMAFAAEISNTDTTPKSATISIEEITDPSEFEEWSVTIPADQTIAWETETLSVTAATAAGQLGEGRALKVGVAVSDFVDGKLTADITAGEAFTIDATEILAAQTLTTSLAFAGWDAVAIASTYTATLTYTAEVVAA